VPLPAGWYLNPNDQREVEMTEQTEVTGQTEFVALRDAGGNYYLLTRDLIESGRVPDNDKAELDEILSGDASGFAFDIGSRSEISFSFGGSFTAPSALKFTNSEGYLAAASRAQAAAVGSPRGD
jgi:hypothetical protein